MKKILKNRELLYKIFVDLYSNDFQGKDLDYQFEVAIRSKIRLMPYKFAKEIKKLNDKNI